MAAEAPHARGEATNSVAGALYISKHICRIHCFLPQQIACPSRQRRATYNWRTKGATDGHAMPGDYVAVNRHGGQVGCWLARLAGLTHQ